MKKKSLSRDNNVRTSAVSCSQCNKRFYTLRLLALHIANKHGITSQSYWKCTFCCKKLLTVEDLKSHLSVAHCGQLEKKYCVRCNCLVKHCDIVEHQKRHRTLQCPLCSEPISHPTEHGLVAHIDKECKKNPGLVQCVVCSTWFGDGQEFVTHLATHEDMTRYSCTLCRAGLSLSESQSGEAPHFEKHLISVPNACHFCGIRVGDSRKDLLDHYAESHSQTGKDGREYYRITCPKCVGRQFSQKNHFMEHFMQHFENGKYNSQSMETDNLTANEKVKTVEKNPERNSEAGPDNIDLFCYENMESETEMSAERSDYQNEARMSAERSSNENAGQPEEIEMGEVVQESERTYHDKKSGKFHGKNCTQKLIHTEKKVKKNQKVSCPLCSRNFRQVHFLADHVVKTHNTRIENSQGLKWDCLYCPKSYDVKHICMRHMNQEHVMVRNGIEGTALYSIVDDSFDEQAAVFSEGSSSS